MRIALPQNLTGKALYKYLVENKESLISKKKSLPIKSDAICCDPSIITPTKSAASKKAGEPGGEVDEDKLRVRVVANAAWWCDHHMDVLTDTCYNKSVKEKGVAIPHIKDHVWSSTAHVGDVANVYVQPVSLKELGVKKSGTTSCLIFETDIRKDYDEDVFKFYKNGKINQHSIGLQYVALELAINDPDYEKEIDFWNKYIDKIINRKWVEEKGYFWLVSEIKIFENSCVLFGANELTPTLETAKGLFDTGEEPAATTTQQNEKKAFDFSAFVK